MTDFKEGFAEGYAKGYQAALYDVVNETIARFQNPTKQLAYVNADWIQDLIQELKEKADDR